MMDQSTEDDFIGIANCQAPTLEIGDQPSKEFLELFSKLDSTINGELIEKAWKHYDTIGQQIVLEGNQNAWMACAFFTNVWQATPFGQELICKYSLSSLLDICEVSVLEFFDKLNNWTELIGPSKRLIEYVKRSQSNLAVAAVCYKKFLPIFRRVFANVSPQKQTRDAAKRYSSSAQRLTSTSLFEFIWTMFVALRKQFNPSQEDLLHSFHLLLALLDYVIIALQQAGLNRHLNTSFVRSLSTGDQLPLELLCEVFDGVVLDAKHLRTHWLLPLLQKLADELTIIGYEANNGGILLQMEENKKAFELLYLEKLVVRSEIDERIFLNPTFTNIELIFNGELDDDAVSCLRKVRDSLTDEERTTNIDLMLKINMHNCLEKLGNQKAIKVPIAGKSYIITPETVCPSTIASDTGKQPQKIRQLINEFKGVQDDLLVYLFEDCQENPREFIVEHVKVFRQKFLTKINEDSTQDLEHDAVFQTDISKWANEVGLLFYYLLQKIMTYDRERAVSMGMEMQLDLGVIFQNVEFLASIYICATELILFSYESEHSFPWSADLLKDFVAPISFYKIFELVVRSATGLGKEEIKHLNKIEECVLDEFGWASDSPLWAILKVSRSMESFGEISNVPSSQILTRSSSVYIQRNVDLPQPIIIFFKKVYHLAAIRISGLCERIRIMEDLTRHKIWTLFEHVFRTQTHFLRDRNLDQLLLCIIYIIAKVSGLDITFQNIIYHYRHQPQSSSRIYRKVLLNNTESTDSQPKEHADLIKFYNCVFVGYVEEFVKLLHPSGSDSKENIVPLIPLPKTPLNPLSPVKLVTERINVIPMSQYAANTLSSLKHRGRFSRGRYDFHKSPSKDLKTINTLIGSSLMQ